MGTFFGIIIVAVATCHALKLTTRPNNVLVGLSSFANTTFWGTLNAEMTLSVQFFMHVHEEESLTKKERGSWPKAMLIKENRIFINTQTTYDNEC